MDSMPRIRKHEDREGGGGGRHGGREPYPRDDRRDRDRDRERERRRSRSPHGHRQPRHEQDSYSSSRDYRAQEREDRYARRDPRRDDHREWDRDRGHGQRRDDRRRGDDDRHGGGGGGGGGGGEREFDRRPRRGGPGGGRGRDERGDRDEFAMQRNARGRSKSPPAKKREPTPDLTDVVPVPQRKRRMTQWDIKPPGYENVTAEQAKLSGMFPLPGAPRQQAIDPSRLQSLINQPGGAGADALKPANARQAKRAVLQNLPASATEESLVAFFNLQLNGLNVVESVDPCTSCQLAKDHAFALLEFKNAIEATVAVAMDGVSMEADTAMNGADSGAGAGLEVRRPKDYISPAASEEEPPAGADGAVASTVPDGPNKLAVTNVLPGLEEEQVRELVSTFGALRSFVLVKDKGTDESRGIAFCEYADSAAGADMAIEGLNGMEVGGAALRVRRACAGASQAGMDMSVNAMSMLAGTTSTDLDEGRVLQLLNMVTAEELMDDEDYAEIVEDVREECAKYGAVLDVKVPRPQPGSRQSAGIGKIFVKFDAPESARRALQSLAGRKFADRTVISTYFSEESFEVNAW